MSLILIDSEGNAVAATDSASSNAVVQVQRADTTSASAIVKAEQAINSSATAVIAAELTDTVLADAIIQTSRFDTANANAAIQDHKTTVSIADAVIQAKQTESSTTNAVVADIHVDTASANAVVSSSVLRGVDLNAIITGAPARSISANAVIRAQTSEQNTLFEKNILRALDPPVSPQQFAFEISTFYENNIALRSIPTPITAGKRILMEKAIYVAVANPAVGSPAKAASGIVQGVTLFWAGVPLAVGGVTITFLGASILLAQLIAQFNNPRASEGQVSKRLAEILKAATRTVQYVIPPAPPAFMAVS